MSNITGTISNINKLSGDVTNKRSLSGTVSSSVDLSGNIMYTILKGLSAYEVAVKNGFVGTEEEWLESLVGNGIDTVSIDSDGYLTLVFTKGGSYTTPISIKGKNGHSPYIGDNGNWYEYDDTQNGYVDTGYSSMTVLGDGLIKDSTTGRISVDYPNALNLPSIENIPLRGNVTLSDLGIEERLAGKVDKVDGKGLSTNDYTLDEKTKLANIESNAQVNVLEGIQKNGTNVTITNKIANITVPTNTNELTNGAGFQTASDVTTAIESALADITNLIPTPDWNESDSTSANYIANKPPIKAGTGTNSVKIGNTSETNIASGGLSLAIGQDNNASNTCSVAVGSSNSSGGTCSMALGKNNIAVKSYSIAAGYGNESQALYSVAIGNSNKATGLWSISGMRQTEAVGSYSTALGYQSKASGNYSIAWGGTVNVGTVELTGEASSTTYTDTFSNQSSIDTLMRYGNTIFVIVDSNIIRVTNLTQGDNLSVTFTFEKTLSEEALSKQQFTLYGSTIATGAGSTAIGFNNRSSGEAAVSFGENNISSGVTSFVEGKWNLASGNEAHAEGFETQATGGQSHSEGRSTVSSGGSSHAEGNGTVASGWGSHSEGSANTAAGTCTHAQGEHNIANGFLETVIGRYNALSNSTAQTSYNTTNSPYILIAGNGTADNARSNAYTLDWFGNGWYAGKLTVGSNPVNTMDVATKGYVDNLTNEIPQPEDDINVLNLLTEFGYSAPLLDADNKVVTDDDGNIILG